MLSKGKRIAYGIGRLGSSMLIGLFSLGSLYVYWEQYGLEPVLAGWMNAVGKVVIAIASPLVGYLSDNLDTRWGKRKPFVAAGAPLLGASFVLYFVPYRFVGEGDQLSLFTYGALLNSLFHFSYALLVTPFQAWMPEITQPEERVWISALQNLSNIVANGLGVIIGFMLPTIIEDAPHLLVPILACLALLEVACYIPSLVFIPREERAVPQLGLSEDLRDVIMNRNYSRWLVARGLLSVAFTMLTALFLSFATDVLGIGRTTSIAMSLFLMLVIAIFFKVWGDMSEKVGKRGALTLSSIVLSFTLLSTPVFGLVEIPEGAKFALSCCFLALGAAGISGYLLFPYAILADIIHEDAVRTGRNRSGLYTGFESIPLNIFQTLAYVLTGYVLTLPEIPDRGYTSGLAWWGPVAATFVFMGIVVLRTTNIDPFLNKADGGNA